MMLNTLKKPSYHHLQAFSASLSPRLVTKNDDDENGEELPFFWPDASLVLTSSSWVFCKARGDRLDLLTIMSFPLHSLSLHRIRLTQ